MVEYIDATNLVVGRLSSYVAKKALEGEEIIIVNAENSVITGTKKFLEKEFYAKRKRGDVFQGPFYPRMPDRILRRMIRGMLPIKTTRGRMAFKRIKVWIGIPEYLKDKNFTTIKEFNINNYNTLNYVKLKDISKFLGARINEE